MSTFFSTIEWRELTLTGTASLFTFILYFIFLIGTGVFLLHRTWLLWSARFLPPKRSRLSADRTRQPHSLPPSEIFLMLLSISLMLYACYALLITWNYIVDFMVQDVERYSSFTKWLNESDMFVQAYLKVADSPGGWMWSGQLLTFVPLLAVYMYEEAADRRLTHVWTYLVLLELCAVSVAVALFICHMLLSPMQLSIDPPLIPGWRIASIVLSFASTALLPVSAISGNMMVFSTSLFTLHSLVVFLALPLDSFFNRPSSMLSSSSTSAESERKSRARAMRSRVLTYAAFTTLFAAYHAYNWLNFVKFHAVRTRQTGLTLEAVRPMFMLLYKQGWSNACQAGITNDLVLSFVLVCVWTVSEFYFGFVPHKDNTVPQTKEEAEARDTGVSSKLLCVMVLALSPVISLASSFAFLLLLREADRADVREGKHHHSRAKPSGTSFSKPKQKKKQ